MDAEPPDAPVAISRKFWVLIGYAVFLGVFGGAFGLLFMWLLSLGQSWYSYSSPGWMGGRWWWVAVTAGAGLVIGVLRPLTRLPYKTPGLIADLQKGYVEPRLVPGILLVSAASLMGGASLGPEKALGSAGGGLGQWISARGRLDDEGRSVSTLSGMAGSYGGLFSSPMIVALMIIEVARPGGARLTKVLVTTVLSASISFGIYFAIAGTVLLDLYKVPAYEYEDWYLLAGVGMGLLAAVVSTLLGVTVLGSVTLFDKLRIPDLVKSIIGGIIFGIIGVMLPLTMMSGSDQLGVVIDDASTLGLGLVIALVIAKMIAMGAAIGSGFVGGPIFPSLFIGGTAGVALHLAIPSLPLGLTFACMLASVVGGFISAPFTMVLFAAFTTQMTALNTAPVLIAVITSFVTVEAVKWLMARRRGAGPSAATPKAEPLAGAGERPDTR